MARPPLTQPPVEDLGARVCTTVLDMNYEQGISSVTLRGLAQRPSCSYAKPYGYFRDEEQLIDAVCGCALDQLAALMPGDGAAAGITPQERYLRFAAALDAVSVGFRPQGGRAAAGGAGTPECVAVVRRQNATRRRGVGGREP